MRQDESIQKVDLRRTILDLTDARGIRSLSVSRRVIEGRTG
jgi:hypothetical protein